MSSWLVRGEMHKGAHYPLLVFTSNGQSNRTKRAQRTRNYNKADKWRNRRAAEYEQYSKRIEPAVAAQQRSAHNQSTSWASFLTAHSTVAGSSPQQVPHEQFDQMPTWNRNDANSQRRDWTTKPRNKAWAVHHGVEDNANWKSSTYSGGW